MKFLTRIVPVLLVLVILCSFVFSISASAAEIDLEHYLDYSSENSTYFSWGFDLSSAEFSHSFTAVDNSYSVPAEQGQTVNIQCLGKKICLASKFEVPYSDKLFSDSIEFYWQPFFGDSSVHFSQLYQDPIVEIIYYDSDGVIIKRDSYSSYFDGEDYVSDISFSKSDFYYSTRVVLTFKVYGTFSGIRTFRPLDAPIRLDIYHNKIYSSRTVRIWDDTKSYIIKTFVVSDPADFLPASIRVDVQSDKIIFTDTVSGRSETFDYSEYGVIDGLVAMPSEDGVEYGNMQVGYYYILGNYESYDFCLDLDLPWYYELGHSIGSIVGSVARLFNIEGLLSKISGFFDSFWENLTPSWIRDLKISVSNNWITDSFNSIVTWIKAIPQYFSYPQTFGSSESSADGLFGDLFGTGEGQGFEVFADGYFIEVMGNFLGDIERMYDALPVAIKYLLQFGFCLPISIGIIKSIAG